MAEKRLSKIQKLIIEALKEKEQNDGRGVERIEWLSYLVAERYGGKQFWTIDDVGNDPPWAKAFARRLHKKDKLVLNKWAATFSRSLRNLEKKGLVVLERGGFVYKHHELYRKVTPQPRVIRVHLPNSWEIHKITYDPGFRQPL